LTSTNPENPRPLLLGHRGARDYAPENTFEAFDLALSHGCDGFEFDVRCTADRRLVICHDATLKRMRVATAAYERLCERWEPRRSSSENSLAPLACLEDVVASYARRAYLDVEIKVPGIETAVTRAIAAHPPQRGYIVSSFLPEIVQNLRAADRDLNLGWIVADRRLLPEWRHLNFHVLVAHYTLVSQDFVKAVHDAGRKLFVWTVNRPKAMLKMADWGVDALISDDTRLLSDTLRGSHR
jgi:glycerophosphoryl diester phosphodiesterase